LSWTVVIVATVLIGLGWLGIARYEDLSETSGSRLGHQIVYSVLAVCGMLALSVPNYRVLCRWSYVLLALAVVLLVAVYFFPPVNNARRWIRFGPVGLQPSEFAKIAYVLALAQYLMYRKNYRRLGGLLAPLCLTLAPVLLILREPDLGTSLVFVPVFFLMLFTAGARWRDLGYVAVVALVMLPLLWTHMSREQQSRVTAWLEQTAPNDIRGDDTYHLHQAKRMLALGGAWGSLVSGQPIDDPAACRLPEARSDFVFCVLGERLGLVGIAVVLGLYALLVWRGLVIAAATREPFGRLVAAGVTAMIAVQVVINTAMTVGLLPITGLSLPLVSYGGSGLLASGLMLGLLLNIGLRPGYEMTNEPFRYVESE
jgi:cell division protein FtsW (lipid II flippase)